MNSISDLATRRHFGRLGLAGLLLGGVAIAVAGLMLGGGGKATAQEYAGGCTQEYKFCITKQTIPAGSPARFEFKVSGQPTERSTVQTSDLPQDEYYLSDGESFSFDFYGYIVITELPVNGWQLVDIDCDYDGNFIVDKQATSVTISYPAGDATSYIDCTFINQQRQPLNLGALIAGQPTPLPTFPPAVAPAAVSPVISPPNTGDGGLR